MVKSFWKKFW